MQAYICPNSEKYCAKPNSVCEVAGERLCLLKTTVFKQVDSHFARVPLMSSLQRALRCSLQPLLKELYLRNTE